MQNNTFFRSGDSLNAFIYRNKGEIVTMAYENGSWSKPKGVADNVRGNYSVNLSQDGSLYIFAQDNQGNIRLYTNNDGAWRSQLIMKSLTDSGGDAFFSAIIKDNNFVFIYNIPPSEGDKNAYLVTQQLDSGGSWTQPVRLDRFIWLKEAPYHLQAVNTAHSLIFYQSGDSQVTLGYREITSEKIGSFTPLHSSQGQFLDSSYLTTQDAIHVCYIVRSLFSSQFIYRKRDFSGFSSPVILWEGNKIENCLLGFFGGRLNAYFTTNGFLYCCASDDGGRSFSRPAKHRNRIAQSLQKAKYISSLPMNESQFFIREVYVDEKNPQDIQLMADICPDFFPVGIAFSALDLTGGQQVGHSANFFEPVYIPDIQQKKTENRHAEQHAYVNQPQRRPIQQVKPSQPAVSFEEEYHSFFNQEFKIPKAQSKPEPDLNEYVERLSQRVTQLTKQLAERDRAIAEAEAKLMKQEEIIKKSESDLEIVAETLAETDTDI